jgi:hypothetical protein
VIAEAQLATVAAWRRLSETSDGIDLPPGLK